MDYILGIIDFLWREDNKYITIFVVALILGFTHGGIKNG